MSPFQVFVVVVFSLLLEFYNVSFFFSLHQLFVSSQSPFSPGDDLYLEGHTSGDLPIDDEDGEDGGSGSGSGDYRK